MAGNNTGKSIDRFGYSSIDQVVFAKPGSGPSLLELRNVESELPASNAQIGTAFEKVVKSFFHGVGIQLESNFPVELGFSHKKVRRFDLGSEDPPVLVECKSHGWTKSGNTPSAKLTIWNEAMHYFNMAPDRYQKILFVRRSLREGRSLSDVYISNYGHLVPHGVEIWEYDFDKEHASRVYPR